MQKVIISGLGAGIVAYILGAIFGTYGAWSIALDQPATPVGRWVMALTIGVILAWVYGYFGFSKSLPGDPVFKGAVFGVFIWLITLIIGAIFVSVGNRSFAPPLGSTLFLSVILHIIWGSSLGYLYQENFK